MIGGRLTLYLCTKDESTVGRVRNSTLLTRQSSIATAVRKNIARAKSNY